MPAEPQEQPAKTRKPRKIRPVAPGDLTALAPMVKDLKAAAVKLGDDEARFLVDIYYSQQDYRISLNHQLRQLRKANEPNQAIEFIASQAEILEGQVARALDYYSDSREEGRWARSIVGIGPVISAGLMAHVDINECPTVGHLWAFAGVDPSKQWLAKTRRPWNAQLKRLCFLIGESFTKTQNMEKDVYGKISRRRKTYEAAKNDLGEYADQAAESLAKKDFSKDTEARTWYTGCYPGGTFVRWLDIEKAGRDVFPDDSQRRTEWVNKERAAFLLSMRVAPGAGVAMLPPARIQIRSQRYAVKLFLSHYHHVLHEIRLGRPPAFPYVLSERAHIAKPELAMHTTFLGPPNWPMEKGELIG